MVLLSKIAVEIFSRKFYHPQNAHTHYIFPCYNFYILFNRPKHVSVCYRSSLITEIKPIILTSICTILIDCALLHQHCITAHT